MGGFLEGVGVYGCGCEQYVGVYVGGGGDITMDGGRGEDGGCRELVGRISGVEAD